MAAPLRDGRTLGRLFMAELDALRLPARSWPSPWRPSRCHWPRSRRICSRRRGPARASSARSSAARGPRGRGPVGAPVAPDTHHPAALGMAPFPGAAAAPTGIAPVARRRAPARHPGSSARARPAPAGAAAAGPGRRSRRPARSRRSRRVSGRGRGRGGSLADLGRVVERDDVGARGVGHRPAGRCRVPAHARLRDGCLDRRRGLRLRRDPV